jgi:acyl-CoA thioesterase
MKDAEQFFRLDSYAHDAGIELLEAGPGKARVKMEITVNHLNSHRTVHGGAIFTLADTAFAVASNSHGIPAAAINAHISYMKSVASGTLFAEAEEFSLNPRLATYTVQVTDQEGNRIAIFQGMVYRKTPPRQTEHPGRSIPR